MKVMKKIMTAAVLAMAAMAFFSCTMDAESNDGSHAGERLEQGYKPQTPQNGGGSGGGNGGGGSSSGGDFSGGSTSEKFWKGWAPFIGIQVWGPSEGWGQAPAIDMDAGTIKAEAATPGVMFPVFGGYNDTGSAIIGSYDCSKVRKIEFEVKANRGGGTMTFASYLSGGEIKHTADEAIPTDFVKKSYAVTGADDVEILFYFNIGLPGKGYTVTVNNVAFYDADGKQITNIPFTPYE